MSDRSVSVGLRAEVAGFVAGIRAAQRQVNAFTVDLQKNSARKQALTDLGNTAGKVGLIAAAGFGLAVKKAADFDSAMSSVEAATHASADVMGKLREAALDAGARTVYSATEAAGAIESLSKAGVAAADIMGGGLNGALDLAAAGQIEVADAADVAATAMTQFKLSGKDVPHIADLLAAGAGKAQGDVSDMAMALKQSGLVAAQFGLSIEDTTGTLAAFASAGLLGSDAGTSFKTMLLRLANPAKESRDAMKALGIEAYNANGQFVGTVNLAGQLQAALKNKTQAERDAALATIFGSDAIRAANVLYNEGAKGIAGWRDNVNDAGYAADTAATKLDNLKGDLEKLSGALDTALIGSGSGSTGVLRELVQGLTHAVDAFNSLPGPVKNASSSLLAITAITGGGLWFGSKVIRGVADTRQAMADLNITAIQSKRALAGISAGLNLAAIVTSINLVDDALDEVFDRRVDTSTLQRELVGLGQSGQASGNLMKTFGADLDGFAKQASAATRGFGEAEDTMFSFIPVLDTGGEKLRENIKDIDGALAAMVESGQSVDAEKIFGRLMDSAKSRGADARELSGWFEQYHIAVKNAADASDDASDSQDNLAWYQVKAQKAADHAKKAQERLAKALKESREAANDTAHEFFNLGDSLDDGKVSLKGWIREMEKQANALMQFRQNAEKAAEKGLRKGLIAALQEAGPEGALRMRQLANATDAEIAKANHAWQAGQTEIHKYTDAVGGVPTVVSTTVKVYTDTSGIDALQYKLNRLAAGYQIPVNADEARAMGGPVVAGQTYLVGEEGPELWTAKQSGYIIPHRESMQILDAERSTYATRGAGHGSAPAPARAASVKGSMRISGTLQIPGFGPAQIRGIAAEVFADESAYEQSKGRMR